ncbi:MAG: pyridoxal phosphate-dependent aminotransferase [Oscillospiraceae bacterium]
MPQQLFEGSAGVRRMAASPIRAVLDRAAALRGQGHRVIPFSAGEPDFNTPSPIKEATIKALEENHTHYGSNRGLPSLRGAISRLLLAQTGQAFHPETEILVTSSGAEAINNVLLAMADPGDEVLIFSPAFVSYKNLVLFCGAVPVEIPLLPEDGFQPSIALVEKSITPKTRLLVLNNPNNPTGAVYSRESLTRLAELAVKHNLLVVSDEMYASLVYEGAEFCSVAGLPGMRERSVIINGFSKTYAMTGWRLGYLAASEKLCNIILRMHQYSTTCSPTFIQKGLADSLELPETERQVQHMLQSFAKRRLQLLNGLEKIEKLRFVRPYGAFYTMVDVSATGLSGMAFAEKLLEEKKVATVPAVGLGAHCQNFIRISYAASEADIDEGLLRIASFCEGAAGL